MTKTKVKMNGQRSGKNPKLSADKLCCSKGIREDCECYKEALDEVEKEYQVFLDTILKDNPNSNISGTIWFMDLFNLKQKIKEMRGRK